MHLRRVARKRRGCRPGCLLPLPPCALRLVGCKLVQCALCALNPQCLAGIWPLPPVPTCRPFAPFKETGSWRGCVVCWSGEPAAPAWRHSVVFLWHVDGTTCTFPHVGTCCLPSAEHCVLHSPRSRLFLSLFSAMPTNCHVLLWRHCRRRPRPPAALRCLRLPDTQLLPGTAAGGAAHANGRVWGGYQGGERQQLTGLDAAVGLGERSSAGTAAGRFDPLWFSCSVPASACQPACLPAHLLAHPAGPCLYLPVEFCSHQEPGPACGPPLTCSTPCTLPLPGLPCRSPSCAPDAGSSKAPTL